MAIVFDSDAGTISGLSVGGLPDGMVDGDMLAANAITAGKIADGTIANADINASAAIAGSKISGSFGKVLQVIYGTTNTQVQHGQTSYIDTGLNASITPSATSSKVLILVSQNIVVKTDTSSERPVYWNIVRDSTQLVYAGSEVDTNTTNQFRGDVFNGLNFLDSPNTTSATTYKTQFKLTAQQADIYAQNNSTNSTIILMEIAG